MQCKAITLVQYCYSGAVWVSIPGTFGGSVQRSGSHAAPGIWCSVYAFGAPASRYLEMQYLVQQHNDKGCELRHKGSVLDVAGAQGVEPI